MKQPNRRIIPALIVIVSIILIAVCFFTSIIIVENYAKDDCFDHIEETTTQISDMFSHAMAQSQTQLSLFADILAANSPNPEALLKTYMEHFCDTMSFSAVCVHKEDGTSFSHGFHPHENITASFQEELQKLPYISDVIGSGDSRKEKYIYLATPVNRGGRTIAILYGYISLETFPNFISSTAYDGKCQFYIVDGNTGDFLMDEYHRYEKDSDVEIPLGNVFDGSMGGRQTKSGYTMEAMHQGMKSGESGYFVFKSQRTGDWYYTYYMPMGINNWSMQITIDESTAFSTYYTVRNTVLTLMICVLLLCLVIIIVLILQTRKRTAQDKKNLHKVDYLNAVQSTLLTAQNNPDFVDRALRLVAREMEAETALLLTFSGKDIHDVYYWPSEDKTRAKALLGMNAQDMFPAMIDALASNESIFLGEADLSLHLPAAAQALFTSFDISNILLVPVSDNAGVLKGAIATINMKNSARSPEMLEYVTRDFYMTVTNLENHKLIKRMGTIDYLTGIKNRNSYEAETGEYETLDAQSLWSVFVDVNGLHELNNSQGHKAGDAMLCTVADAMRRIFGEAHTYRMGGDEFVAFRINSTHEELMNCKYRLLDTLAKRGYSASVGFAGTAKNENGIFDVEKVTGEAEAIMYREKWKYYQKNGISTERKYLPPDQRESQSP